MEEFYRCCGTCEFGERPLTCILAEKMKQELLEEKTLPSALEIKTELVYYDSGKSCECWKEKIKK